MNSSKVIDQKYLKKRPLGEGRYGAVWEAGQLRSPFKNVAVKIVRIVISNIQISHKATFKNELKMMKRLSIQSEICMTSL